MNTNNQTMYIAVDCLKCDKLFHLPATQEQMDELDKPRSERMYMQDIFPNLSVADRELLISGTCYSCWDKMFPEVDHE